MIVAVILIGEMLYNRGLNVTDERMRTRMRSICIIVICTLLLSCNSLGEYYDRSYNIPNDCRGVSGYGIWYSDMFIPWTDEERQARIEWEQIRNIERLKTIFPSRTEECESRLKKIREDLEKRYEERVAERLAFLKSFYKDLYRYGNRDFSNLYRKCCSRELRSELRYMYKLRHHRKGYAWSSFTDNELHPWKDFKFTYMDMNPQLVENKMYRKFMYYRLARKPSPDYRYTNEEDKWYRVDMGEHCVYVQVDGTGKGIQITGVVNPGINFTIKNRPQFGITPPPWKIS